MRVLTVTNMYPTPELPHYGIFTENHVNTLRRQGLDIDVFFTDPTTTRSRYVRELPRLRRVLRFNRYDVIHAHHTYCVFQIACARLALRESSPLLLTFHEGEAGGGWRDPEADLLKRLVYVKSLKRWALEASDCVVSVEARLPRAVGFAGDYVVIAPGIDVELFKPVDRRQARARIGVARDAAVLLFPALPWRREKGIELFRAALSRLDREIEVLWGGDIQPDEMPLYMNAADVVVQTSRYEASPMVVKEAMACNARVVSTDVGDVAQVFGETPGHWLTRMDPDDVARNIEAALDYDGTVGGRERLLELGLSLEGVAARYTELYSEVARAR